MQIWKPTCLRRWTCAVVLCALIPAFRWNEVLARQKTTFESTDRQSAVAMFDIIHEALKKNYYDPAFHGVDMEARYKVYAEKVKNAPSLVTALRMIAAYLVVLDDSHTVFLPPDYNFHFDYGYRMQLIADQCFITGVRPGSDAAAKLHPGDQVLTLDGFALNRKDLWQLEYYLNALGPKSASNFVLRDPAGSQRSESVVTAHGSAIRFKHLSPYDRLDLYEKWRHQMRERFVEIDDALIWKMRGFFADDAELDRIVGMARKHQALILDLRGNGGGSVDTLRSLISSLIDHDVHVGTSITRKGKLPIDVKPHKTGVFTGKLVVLIDSRSASASEILARIVQLEHRGTVVGDRSAGSVMEAKLYPFQFGLGLVVHFAAEITSADLVMSDGKSLERVGVIPDLLSLPTAADLAQGRDPVLAKAAELAGAKLDPAAAGKMFPFEWPPE